MNDRIRIGVLGASGYTGADLVRLALAHPRMEITALTANTHAGKAMAEVFPHLGFVDLPRLTTVDEADWGSIDAVFCGLPHGTTQEITKKVLAEHPHIKFIDMSADFRLRDPETYKTWYGHEHLALDLQAEAVYGLTEHYRTAIRDARLVACPGCYPTATLLSLLPLASSGLVDVGDIVIDAKSGVSGAGRGAQAEPPLHRGRRGHVALFRRQAPPCAGDRAGDLQGRRARTSSSTSPRTSSR